MKTGVEINMVVENSLKALELYEKTFEIKRIEVSDFPKGENEVIFSLYGVHFHMLDKNPKFGLEAPKKDKSNTISYNVSIPDIKETFEKVINEGCKELQEITEIQDFGVSNAIFRDPFGYIWLIHQVHKEVSYEERTRLWEEKKIVKTL